MLPQHFTTYEQLLSSDQSFVEVICMSNHTQPEIVLAGIREFFATKLITLEYEKLRNESDVRKNLLFWFRFYLQRKREDNPQKSGSFASNDLYKNSKTLL